MISVRITRKGTPLQRIPLNFKKKIELTKMQVRALSIETRDKFREIIRMNKKQGRGKLEKLIEVEYFVDGVSWGVGNINLLDKEAPYWKNVNWGHKGYTIRAKNKKFLRFKDKDGKIIYRKEVHNHAVHPMNFLERTTWWFKRRLLTLIKGLK